MYGYIDCRPKYHIILLLEGSMSKKMVKPYFGNAPLASSWDKSIFIFRNINHPGWWITGILGPRGCNSHLQTKSNQKNHGIFHGFLHPKKNLQAPKVLGVSPCFVCCQRVLPLSKMKTVTWQCHVPERRSWKLTEEGSTHRSQAPQMPWCGHRLFTCPFWVRLFEMMEILKGICWNVLKVMLSGSVKDCSCTLLKKGGRTAEIGQYTTI